MATGDKLVSLDGLKAAYDKLNILTYAPAANIASNTDLNTLITSGVYAAGTRAIAGSLTNKPDALTENFRMIVSDVTRSTSTNRSVIQIILERPSNLIFTRTGSSVDTGNPLWTGWSEVAKTGFFPFMNADAKGSFSTAMYRAIRFVFTEYDKTKTYSLQRVIRNYYTGGTSNAWVIILGDNEGTTYTVLNGYAAKVGYTQETGETIFDFDINFDGLKGKIHIDWSAFVTMNGETPEPTYSKADLGLRIDPIVFYISEVLNALDAQAEADATAAADKKARELFLNSNPVILGLNGFGGKAMTTSEHFGHTGKFIPGGQTIKTPDGYSFRRLFAFDSARQFIKYEDVTTQSYDMPSSITVNNVTYNNVLFRFTFAKTPYSSSNVMDISEMTGGVKDGLWDIPSDVYGVIGHPFSIHYENILRVDSLAGYHVYVMRSSSALSSHAINYGNRLRFACDETSATDYPLWLCLYKGDETVSIKKVTVHILAESVPSIKALFIGDSFTDQGYYLSELKRMMGNSLTLYGTVGFSSVADSTGTNQSGYDEGRSGWSLKNYCQTAENNPFYDSSVSGDNKFSFSKYLTDNPSFNDVTDVFILSGPNDYNSETRTNTNYLAYYKFITDDIKTVKPGVRVHCMMPSTISSDSSNGMYEFRSTMQVFGKGLIGAYGGSESSGIYVVPTHLNMDRNYDLGSTTITVTDRNPATVTIAADNIHPSAYGYYGMADMIFGHIVAKCQS